MAEDSYDFRYDSLISPHETTDTLYSTMIAPIVQAALDGFNSTCVDIEPASLTHTVSSRTVRRPRARRIR